MTGIPEYNYPLFRSVAAWLRDQGLEHIEDPSTNFGDDVSLPRRVYLEAALTQLIRCQSIVLLPDWLLSEGARMESGVARALGMTCAGLCVGRDGYAIKWIRGGLHA